MLNLTSPCPILVIPSARLRSDKYRCCKPLVSVDRLAYSNRTLSHTKSTCSYCRSVMFKKSINLATSHFNFTLGRFKQFVGGCELFVQLAPLQVSGFYFQPGMTLRCPEMLPGFCVQKLYKWCFHKEVTRWTHYLKR